MSPLGNIKQGPPKSQNLELIDGFFLQESGLELVISNIVTKEQFYTFFAPNFGQGVMKKVLRLVVGGLPQL